MARFIRDEKKTFPIWWLAAGGMFIGSAFWATYAELVTRVPWQESQKAFFEMELEQSTQALARAKNDWTGVIEPSIKDTLDKKAAIEESMRTGPYKASRDRLDKLNKDFADAEVNKTFGASDLDEAYYYRNLAEYDRDAAATEVRRLYREAYAVEDPAKGNREVDAIYADPPQPARGEETDKLHHLLSEIARMQAHIAQIDKAVPDAPPAAKKALAESKHREEVVVDHLKVELKHQKRVDDAVAAMTKIDGPVEPPLSEKDPAKRAEEKKRERERVCKGIEDTRNCIIWLQLEPVDMELKALEVDISKKKRPLVDAQIRSDKAVSRARPAFDPANIIQTIVGPFQIQQVVLHWIEYEREVDIEQVDRCHTCHMGTDSSNYTDASIPKQFRTHPNRSTLLATHPVDQYGCTACHQGQGRATDMLSHSAWRLEEHHGEERWHFQGDHYWEDPLLPVGDMRRVVIDGHNDEFAIKLGKSKWETISIDHRTPDLAAKNPETQPEYKNETEFLGALQEKVAKVVAQDADVASKWHAVVRKVNNRIQIGVEQNDPSQAVAAKDVPAIGLRFPKPELGRMLGFGESDITTKQPIQTAVAPPSVPVRSDGMDAVDKDGRYHPPSGALGLQVPDEMRNRFIQALPEVESGCLRCHTGDMDLKPRGSKAKYVAAKLDYQKAEAAKKKDPAAYKQAHDGSDELPAVPADPTSLIDPVPTFTEGRALFRKLNCTGCHILEGFPWDRNSGPALDHVTAKVAPEWLLGWIRNPRGWRAKTRMPNLWPKPLDPASKRPYPPSAPEYQKWEALMREETIAVASYLIERSDNPASKAGASKDAKPLVVAGYADVPGASIEKGKLVFESYGCQGCHARSDADTPEEKLPDAWRRRERDVAPTLSNLGEKTTADWIAYWVEDPSRYWHGTKMPSLRLTREEAASVGKYLASLKSKPLDPATAEKSEVALLSDAAKRNEKVPCSQAGGALMTRVECGEKLIGYYGCFGCHEIGGFEKSAPVAPELGAWAKKDVTTLDFGYAIADHHLQTTETFATLKLDAPRIYRRDRIELRMGDFDLSSREIRSLVIFLKGLVAFKPKAAYNPAAHPAYAAVLEGRQIVDDYNCSGCHLLEEQGGDIDGFRQAQLSGDPQARAPYLTGEGMRVQPEWLFSFLRDPQKHGIRPWLHPEWAWGNEVPDDKKALRMPTFNFSNEQVTAIVRYFASWDGQPYPYQAVKANELTEEQKLYTLTHMIASDAANCLSCHYQGEFPVERGRTELAKMAPNFNIVATRLRPEWVKAWLLKPQNWMPYTKMTAFFATVDREKDNAMWPSESDPFRSPALAWNKVPGFPAVTVDQQAEMVRDFLFGMPPNATFPLPGQEADSPLVRKAAPEQPKAEGEKAPDDKAKDKTKRTGQRPFPVRM